jgi:tetratricopeptide (TPR) repeat protein
MKKLFYLFLLTLAGGNTYAQGTSEPKYVRDANTAFESGKFHEAIDKLEAAYDKMATKSAKEKGKVRFKLAEAYREISRYEEANENYDVCIELKYFDVNPDVYFFKR